MGGMVAVVIVLIIAVTIVVTTLILRNMKDEFKPNEM